MNFMFKFGLTSIIIVLFCSLSQAQYIGQHDYTEDCGEGGIKVDITTVELEPNNVEVSLIDCDNDGVLDSQELLPFEDTDGDGDINMCDPDSDNDGILDGEDDCPLAVGTAEFNGCTSSQSERYVFWMHGYQGNFTAWQKASGHSEGTWKIVSSDIDYNAAQESLNASSARVQDEILEIANLQTNPEQNFVIAHSMGGLVLRNMGVPQTSGDQSSLGGMITVATPHQGAGPANILINRPEIFEYEVNQACTRLTTPLLSESLLQNPYSGGSNAPFTGLGFITNTLVAFGLVDNAVGSLCQEASTTVLNGVIDFAATGIEPELTTAAVASLPPLVAQHNAAAYGIEDQVGIAGRMLGATKDGPASDGSWPLFTQGDSDALGIADLSMIIAEYQAGFDMYDANATCICFPPCGCLSYLSARRKVAGDFLDALSWFRNIDNSYTRIIGAGGPSGGTPIGCDCIEYEYGNITGEYFVGLPSSGDCRDIEDDFYDNAGPADGISCSARYDVQFRSKPSDGFITSESASNAPGINYPIFLMPGSNHLQMKNDQNADQLLKLIFDSGWNRDFFQTDQR